ncbi:MAG: hypothetical protein ABF292_11310 [Desulfobacterales bacterium]
MKKAARIMLGSLGVAHFVVAIALLPVVLLALSYGFFLNLVILPGLTWLGILGWRLFRPNESLRRTMRITHLVLAPCAVFLVSRGFLFLNAAERSAPAGGDYVTQFGVTALVMGLLAGGLSIASLCISFSSAFKAATAAGMPAPAGGGRNDSVLPELSSPDRRDREPGRAKRWTIRCLALVHYALGLVLLLLAAWWIFASFRVLPHMSHGTIWTNLPMAFTMAAVQGGPLTGLGVWMMILGRRTWRGHPGVRRALTWTHGVLLLPGILTSAVGFYALRDAAESAARGGGLLGPIGIFPLAVGLGVVMLAAGSIVLALTVLPGPKEPPL